MDVSATGISTTGTTSDVAGKKLAENYDTFLTLLTTQLKNQDPLQPTDSNEFVRQLVQFSQVEQSITTNKSLEQLLALQTTGESVAALNYIGKTVEAFGNSATLDGGKATFTYAFPEAADSAKIGIYDSNGKLVVATNGETSLGKHTFVWDGLDSNGNAVAQGNYTMAVSAKNKDGASLEAVTGVIAKVTGVETGKDGTLLALGGVNAPLGDVISVKETANIP